MCVPIDEVSFTGGFQNPYSPAEFIIKARQFSEEIDAFRSLKNFATVKMCRLWTSHKNISHIGEWNKNIKTQGILERKKLKIDR